MKPDSDKQLTNLIDQMAAELERMGWKKWIDGTNVWQSPNGALWLGTYQAWEIATRKKSL